MATAYSEEVNPGGTGYNRIRLRVEYSGTSASCYIEFRRTSSWSDTWGDDAASITFNGQTVSAPYWYTGTVDGTWRTIDSASGFTVPINGGTFSWHFNNPLTGSVLDCGGNITIPSQAVAPSGLAISNITASSDSVTATVSVSAWNGGSASTRYLCLSLCTGQSVATRKWVNVYGNSLSATLTIDNNTVNHDGTVFTITPNTQYYVTCSAGNGDLSTGNTTFTSVTTSPAVTAKLYGSVNGNAKQVQKLYCSLVALQTAPMSVTSDTEGMVVSVDKNTFFAKMKADHLGYLLSRTLHWEVVDLRVVYVSGGGTWQLSLRERYGQTKLYTLATGKSAIAEYGVTLTSGTVPNNSIAYIGFDLSGARWREIAKEVTKLYGSVNGQAKLIYEG